MPRKFLLVASMLVGCSSSSSEPNAYEAVDCAPGASSGPGASTSGMWLYGRSETSNTIPGGYLPPGSGGADADGRTPKPIDTEPSGSTFYVAVSRPSNVSDTAITDNKGNTYSAVATGDYKGIWPLLAGVYVAVDGTGGAGHEITAKGILENELTIGFDEIKSCASLVDYATSYTTRGSKQISPSGVDLAGPGWVYVDWFGDSPTSGSEGSVWTVAAQDEGATVGSQWQVVDARLTNRNDGWIQWKRWRRYFPAAAENIQLQLSSLSPAQGARWFTAAFGDAPQD